MPKTPSVRVPMRATSAQLFAHRQHQRSSSQILTSSVGRRILSSESRSCCFSHSLYNSTISERRLFATSSSRAEENGRKPVVLFGYDSSAFTQKARVALRIKQVPYSFLLVPSMMPRPILKDNLNLTYRKIPVLAIGRDIYSDTSLILEALEQQFPAASDDGYGTLYPSPASLRPLIRGFASYWIDRPFFRAICGLMPAVVWRTQFGADRAGLIGHKLDADKLERKIPQCLSGTDMHFSILEPLFSDDSGTSWVFPTEKPSAADVALFYQLDWGEKISRGEGIADLTAGGTADGQGEGMASIFNKERYPGLWKWYGRFKTYVESLPEVETRVEREDESGVQRVLEAIKSLEEEKEVPMMHTSIPQHRALDERNGLVEGARVSVAPDDTGRWDPTVGTLVKASPEEVVIVPADIDGKRPKMGNIRVHFPRVGFVVKPL